MRPSKSCFDRLHCLQSVGYACQSHETFDVITGSINMFQSINNNVEQWDGELARLPDHALAQLRLIQFYLKLLPENKNRRRAYKKFRSFRLRCMYPKPADDPISDSDDSPGEFADGIAAGLTKLTSAFTACAQRMKKPLLRFALQQLRQNSKKRSFSQALKTGQVTLCID